MASPKQTNLLIRAQGALDPATLEMYQSFMAGYVRRINEATFKVAIGGIRIGSAKYSRLAQINLKTRIMTFSRYAIENVPERGRRYLVLHELAHVKEASHNRRFWQLVASFEPNYKQISRNLELAFKHNVKEETQKKQSRRYHNLFSNLMDRREEFKSNEFQSKETNLAQQGVLQLADDHLVEDEFICLEEAKDTADIGSGGHHQLIKPTPVFQQLSLFD
jgi:hypothetical protein